MPPLWKGQTKQFRCLGLIAAAALESETHQPFPHAREVFLEREVGKTVGISRRNLLERQPSSRLDAVRKRRSGDSTTDLNRERTLDNVLQVPDVPRPVVCLKDRHGIGRHAIDRFSHLRGEAIHKMTDEVRDVFFSLAKGGEPEGDNVHSVEEILPEPTLANQLFEVAI